ncbi:efflux RND transporter periplasmic adaptor subunit [Roseateles sp. BYS96W]|uniref:Efflux RND transporter periplasmic adaptor subunit n=1 Tax=Pelomonas nitida TaxID=3299027 RepID=A0ABW7G865_9BURK
MNITRPQAIAMAALLVLGSAGTTALLLHERGHDDAPHEAHGDEARPAGHDDDSRDRHLSIDDARREAAGIAVAVAGPATLQRTTHFAGEIRLDEDRTAHIVPRVAGVAEAVPAQLGQPVRRGDMLAVIASPALAEQRSELLSAQRRQEAARLAFEREDRLWRDRIAAAQDREQAQTTLREADIAVANAQQKLAAVGATGTAGALNQLALRAPLDGVIVEKHLTRGEAVKDDTTVFTIADLSHVAAEFAVAPKDLADLRTGQRAVITSTAFDGRAEGRISYVGALLGEPTRTARARVALANPQAAWRPGLFVTVQVLGGDIPVPLAVPTDAVQTLDGQTVVFKAVPGGFEAAVVTTGRADDTQTEIVAGLTPGDRIATKNAFVLKAELGKASAAHDH